MRSALAPLAAASVMVLAAAVGAQSASLPTINATMTQVFAVNAQTIWDISSKAFNKKGDGLLASKISAKDWKALEQAGRQLQDRSMLLARAPRNLVVVGRDEQVMGQEAAHTGAKGTWDAASPKQIKALIDANPALFTKRAMILADAGAALAKAAKVKDVRTVYRVSSELDEYCDGCHQPFWGTDEPPPVPAAVKKAKPLGG